MDNKTLLNPPIRMTEYYFDTFIVGMHHSVPHLIAYLLSQKELINEEITIALPIRKADLLYYEQLIDNKLSTLDCTLIDDIDFYDRTYWVNELGRVATIEINTYGRIRPETMQHMMCLSDDDFIEVMSIVTKLTKKIQKLEISSEQRLSPLPASMAVVS